jgi:hypothetical protein
MVRAERILRALGSFARLSADPLGQTNLPLVDEMASLSLSHCCTVIKSANSLPQRLFTNQKYSSVICVLSAVNLVPSEAFGKRVETQKALKTGLQRQKYLYRFWCYY